MDINKYLDLEGLDLYDELIKSHITTLLNDTYKTILLSSDNKTVNFYKKANATLSDTPDFTLARGTAVTLNGVDKAGTSAGIYAPTSAGNNGQVLVSNGSGAPSWGSISMYTPTYNSTTHSLVFTKS